MPVAPVPVEVRSPHLLPTVLTLDQLLLPLIVLGSVVFGQIRLGGEALVLGVFELVCNL